MCKYIYKNVKFMYLPMIFFQVVAGRGNPSATHSNTAVPSFVIFTSFGSIFHFGGTEKPPPSC